MGSLKRKARYAHVIELSILPACFIMAAFAVGGESQGQMRGIAGIVISRLVTGQTGCRRAGKALGMALTAIYERVGSAKRKCGCMFEMGLPPARGVRLMAILTIEAETGQDMIGIGCAIEAFYMTALANCRRPGEFILTLTDMAGIAVNYGVNA